MLATQKTDSHSIPVYPLTPNSFKVWYASQSPAIQKWLTAVNFSAKKGQQQLLSDREGRLVGVVIGIDPAYPVFAIAPLVDSLPKGKYHLVENGTLLEYLALGWGLAGYHFSRYQKDQRQLPTLLIDQALYRKILPLVKATALVRDLINTPAEDMGPEALSSVARTLAKQYKAKFREVKGDVLLKKGFPTIHAIGRACDEAPRLLEINWGLENAPHIVLIGKGVCFDTGGLNIKTDAGMRLMKKDMGGAAHVLGLAQLVMEAKLPVKLTVLIPAVENSVSGSAVRPGDVIVSRSGQTIEIGDTDAEGRVILADAISYAMEKSPELLIDFSTLTGAARIALGPMLPALFSNDAQLAELVVNESCNHYDPLWQLPLFQPYKAFLESNIADINNISNTPYGGAITAALFLQHFVGEVSWLHIDLMAWNLKSQPGRPEGGEAMGLRTLFAVLADRFQGEK